MLQTPPKHESRKRPTQSTLRRRWFRIGPGLLLAIVASFFVWRQMPQNAPRIERAPLAGVPTTGLSAPEPAWVLAQRDELQMSAAQWQKLSRLRARWERDTRELRQELERASTDFNRGMAQEKGGQVTMQQLQERAAPVSELSRQLALARSAWWSEAGQVFSRKQRQRAEQEWARRFTNKSRN